ncbi:periostin-like [Pollicipes pollicipes]|uniref:periostin-like n=2 Tax=Pollicipes pollicipes TaxID=41117 RepID=UPI001885257E|nr:periostin-like [Pollicipes pollicipes]
MKWSVVLLALGLASLADAFFFPFFNKGKGGGQSHKHGYPGGVLEGTAAAAAAEEEEEGILVAPEDMVAEERGLEVKEGEEEDILVALEDRAVEEQEPEVSAVEEEEEDIPVEREALEEASAPPPVSYLPPEQGRYGQGQASDKVPTYVQPGPQVALQAAASGPEPVAGSSRVKSTTSLPERLRQLGLLRFMALVERAGLEKLLLSRGGFTVFAFTDEAWAMLPYNLRAQLTADPERLRRLLLHHITPVALKLASFNDNMVVKSASPSGATLRINIYQMSRYSKRVVTVNGAQVLRSDASASSGVVHVIDRALVAEASVNALEYVTTRECADLDFGGIASIVARLGVTELLSQEAPLTLFLPISAAFSDTENVSEDFSNSSIVMQNSLLYHLVPGAFYSAGVRDGQWLETLLDGQELQLQVVTDGYTRRISTVSKQAQVIRADIPVANGVIHIIDFVLRPERNLQRCDAR